MRRLSILAWLAVSASFAGESPLVAAANWIQAQGGDVVRAKDGTIIEVSLARTWATDNDLERIIEIPTIQRLDLSLTYVSDAGIERLRKLTDLEDLNLYASEFITDAAISYLRGDRKLRRLNLRGTDVTDTSLEFIASLTGLRSLDISETQISDVGLEHLASLAELEYLNLGGNKISGVSLNVLKLLPKLKILRFDGTQRRNAGLCWGPVITDQELDTIALLTNLEELNIGWGIGVGLMDPAMKGRINGEGTCRMVGGIRVTDLGVAKLAKLKHLRRLDISGSAVTAAGLKALRSLPDLEMLSAWNTPGMDDSAAAELALMPNLTSLDLSYTTIGDNGLRSLAGLRKLRWLFLTDTKVTAAGFEAFRKTRSDCQVSWAQRPPAKPSNVKPFQESGKYGENGDVREP